MNRYSAGLLAAIAVGILIGPAGAQNKNEADGMFEAARQKESLEGDLNGAIKQYAAIVSKYLKTDRPATAKALVRMADCYQKMGDAEARKIYEQVVREYGDQKEAVTLARARMGSRAQPGRQTNTLVWSSRKVDTEGRVSPDGRYLPMTDWDSGNLALYEFATGTDRRVTNNNQKKYTRFAEGSVISKDGKQIVYNWYDDTDGHDKAELWLANLSGDPNPRRLYANPDANWFVPYDWSMDGRFVAVDLNRKDRTTQIGLVSVADGSFRVLKSVDWRDPLGMFFSPDGKYLGYDLPASDTTQERDVFVLAIDGSREVPIVVHRGQDTMMGWSPDGKHLLFGSDRAGSMDLWSLPVKDGTSQGPPEMLQAGIGAISLGLTSSGALYYAREGGGGKSKIQTASFDFSTGQFLSVPSDVSQEYFESNRLPVWSPDGKYLAYVSERASVVSRNPVLAIRSMETGEVRNLRPKLTYFNAPAWAPDGRSFLTVGTDFKGRNGVFQIDAQTGDVSPLVLDQPGERSLYAAWSRDGKSFYFPRQDRKSKVIAFIQRDLTSGTERELIRRPTLGNVNLSPDGRYMATPSVDPASNSRTLMLIPADGGEPRVIMRVPYDGASEDLTNGNQGLWFRVGCWAPDSRSLLIWRVQEGKEKRTSELWRVPIDGDEPRKLDSKLDLPLGGIRFHPDGRQIAFTVTETGPRRNPEVWVLENFLPTGNAK